MPRILTALFAALILFSSAAFAAFTTPTSDFTDNKDGTVTHKITGLTWKRCAEGMTWTGTACTGTAATYDWATATALTSTFAGKSDWRLPTIAELVTIVEREKYNPAINDTVFPNTPASNFWSASAYAGSSGDAWFVYFSSGGASSSTIRRAPTMFVSCVADRSLTLGSRPNTPRHRILPTTATAPSLTPRPA